MSNEQTELEKAIVKVHQQQQGPCNICDSFPGKIKDGRVCSFCKACVRSWDFQNFRLDERFRSQKSWTLEELKQLVEDIGPRLDDYDTIRALFDVLEEKETR